ncbi:MAG: PASTA domain-containing protein [Tenuifilum sp.]|uniref:PASTA domain-containing protein n=1 Tax=Tenuifilum sp. TaxID=2760880 RepID=UPI002CFFBF3E|nr:PASTA domain-containing protein [Tenuifilum sp.]HOK84830.1 PASTA domain-containing protein [Tenuifilum sp.]HON69489.1 PASTA domain-containing protein [Tenuifilum sp.]HOU73205.1 PASTA domain-containing protein [Tenuifilum sp.]HPP89083.1 PASTA domain-containing protein [Tenuifilum sp.]
MTTKTAFEKVKQYLLKIYKIPYVNTIINGLGLILGVLIVLMIFLRIYTRHNQEQPTPTLLGMAVEEAAEVIADNNLRIEIADSVYIFNKKPGSVISQNPEPGTMVKKNRRVFVTINAKNPIKIEIPNIVGYTLRQAKAILEQEGFEVGTLYFRPDLGLNNVLEQRFEGKIAEPGTRIPKGSKIDLVLGQGMQGERTGIPLLIGLKLNDAVSRIIEASLNVGRIRYDETIITHNDSLDARVYSQYPAYMENATLGFGTRVDIWLTLNQARIPKIERADSVNTMPAKHADEIIE